MTRSLIVFVVLVLTVPMVSYSQVSGFVESKNTVKRGVVTPSINIVASGKLRGSVGWSLYSLTSEKYSEAYAGPTWSPLSWLELGGSVGLENSPKPFRYASSVWVGKGRYSILTIHESSRAGGSGYWQMTRATVSIFEGSKIGFYSQRFVGNGPYLEKTLGRRLTAWASSPIDNGRVGMLLGLRFAFQ